MDQLSSLIQEHLMTVLVTVIVFQFRDIKKGIETLTSSVTDLNTTMERLIKDVDWHKSELDEQKDINKDLYNKIDQINEKI